MTNRTKEPASDQIFVATESFACEVDGKDYQITKGVTRVRAGHALLRANPAYFRPVQLAVHHEVEAATAGPNEKRGE